jgi:signal transduction histidine kinase/CheY-like chemotaxis protein
VVEAAREEHGEPRAYGSMPAVLAMASVVICALAAQLSDVAALQSVSGRQMFSAFTRYGSYASGVLAAIAALLIWRLRLFGRSLFLWLIFVLIAEAAAVWLSTFGGTRYTLAWYATRVEGVIANTVVLLLLANHFRQLQNDLSATVDTLQSRTEGLQAEILKRENAEFKLAQAKKLEAVGQLGAGLAHDLNNILQVITSRLLILRRRAGDVVEADLEVIRRSVRRAETLTRQLTLLSGNRSLNAKALELASTLPAMAESLRALLDTRHQLTVHVEPDVPVIVVDPLELEIALTNLVTNARDAMPGGGEVHLAVTEELGSGGDRRIRLEVRDRGEGMSADLMERIFEPFFTTKEPGKGTGLGLPQVHGFMKASDGTVSVKSQPGAGTVVTLSFPTQGKARGPSSQEAISPGFTLPLRTGKLVLLVDDNEDVREASAQLLASTGCLVRQADSASEAFTLLKEGLSPDLLITDIVMPGGQTGVDLARRARTLQPELRIVLVTGYSDAAASAQAQGFPVIRKPYDLASLARALD